MCSPVKLHKPDRTEGRTRPVEAHDVKLERSMTDDITTYLRALDCRHVLDVDREDGEVMDNRRPAKHDHDGVLVSDVPAALVMAGWAPIGFCVSAGCPLEGQGNG